METIIGRPPNESIGGIVYILLGVVVIGSLVYHTFFWPSPLHTQIEGVSGDGYAAAGLGGKEGEMEPEMEEPNGS